MTAATATPTTMSIDYLLNPRERTRVPLSHRCSTCGNKFSDSSELRKHQRLLHPRERPYKCQQCDASFSEKGNLNKHIKSCHQKLRDFACDECHARFAFQDGLTRHVDMVHRNVRPFHCPDAKCDKAFKQRAHAEKHFASVHEKKRPCKCFCGSAFREKYNLKMHQKAVHGITAPPAMRWWSIAFIGRYSSKLDAHLDPTSMALVMPLMYVCWWSYSKRHIANATPAREKFLKNPARCPHVNKNIILLFIRQFDVLYVLRCQDYCVLVHFV